VSFILDALRKSEHERQRSALPGLASVPVATPHPALPRWVVIVMAMLVTAVIALGVAWYRSVQPPAGAARSAIVERPVELPPAPARPAAVLTAPARSLESSALRSGEQAVTERGESLAALAEPRAETSATPPPADDAPALPSAAALAAQGVALPPLRLELHAFSESPRDRFVFINGRKYVEGERLPEGPELVTIEPAGAVLRHAGRRFLLVPE
jgi:general secretion pathway protein B